MERELRPSLRRITGAVPLFLAGLTKKLVVADHLAVLVDPVFANPLTYSRGTVISAVMAYSFQIYCDFSGYTDMAIATARMIGIDLPRNFRRPYAATSITAFWRRWHITLSEWLRDYLYIPLGGNRRGLTRTYVNLLITMALGGLWHGASWTFVVWGCYHGAGLAIHKAWSARTFARRPAPAAVGWAATYAFVCIGWVFFRASSMAGATAILRAIVAPSGSGLQWFFLPFWILLGVAALTQVDFASIRRAAVRGRRWIAAEPFFAGFVPAFPIVTWVIAIAIFGAHRQQPFIYFRF
jgi:alginate O-acetyltransferase complex protein AlgI